jgi:hypothetical protein
MPVEPTSGRMIGDVPDRNVTTGSKKVDDISRHESKHSLDPKQDPKHIVQEKPADAHKVPEGPPAPLIHKK